MTTISAVQMWRHCRSLPAALGRVMGSSFISKRWRSSSADLRIKNHVPEMTFLTGNFTEYMMENSYKWSNNTALCCDMSPRRMSYGELRDCMGRWGSFLKKKGLGKGSVVAVVSPNTIDLVAMQYGTIGAGAIYCGINPLCTVDEIAIQLRDSNCQMIVCFGPLEPLVRKALKINKQDLPIFILGPESPSQLPRVENILNDRDLGFVDPEPVSGSETMAIFYSSGTTGSPKGTVISHNSGIANLQMLQHPRYLAAANTTVENPKRYLLVLPQFHIGGFIGVAAVGLRIGLELYNCTKFDPRNFVQYIRDNKLTHLHLVPSILNFMLSRPEFTKENFGFIEAIFSGAAPVPQTSVAAAKEIFGDQLIIQNAYGMTEVLIAVMDPLDGLRLGYTGQLLPTVEAKIVDLVTREPLPAYKDGEIVMRSVCRMGGYLNNEEATKNTMDADGWVYSGDVGQYDEDGFIKVVDRTKELIKVNALQVSPSEIESVILKIPEVSEVSVIGIPHKKYGEVPRAYVVTVSPIDESRIIEHVKENCAKHKHLLGGVKTVPQLPKNATGKVMRKELVKMAKEEGVV